jgi:hypothetical protein
MRSMVKALATAVSMALLASGVAVADTVTTTFECLPPGIRRWAEWLAERSAW